VNRSQKAMVIAMFVYVEYALAIASGLFVIPMTLHYVGPRTWGLWLTSGEVLGYAGMVDFGTLGIMQWLIAEAEGGGDLTRLRRLTSQGLWLGVLVAGVYGVAALALWHFLPSMLFLRAADRAVVGPPLTLLVVVTMATYPLGIFRAVLGGVQDVVFNGILTALVALVSVAITVGMLWAGYGLYALAAAAAAESLLAVVVAAGRVALTRPELLPRLTWPRFTDLGVLCTQGTGAWLGGLGWHLLAATNSIVITYLGHPEWVAVFACTSKASMLSMQLAWVLPDSGHVGLAQLYGEQPGSPRLREVIVMMLRLHLLLAGGAAVGLLAFNPAFVTRWVGAAMFGGLPLNALLAFTVVLYSIVHGLSTTASILGYRPQIGLLVLVNGGLQLLLSIVLGHRLGITGVAWAGLIAGAATALPGGLVLLRKATALDLRGLRDELLAPWMVRIAPIAALAAVSGSFYQVSGVWAGAAIAASLGLLYLWVMRPYYAGLPFGPVTPWLVRLRLLTPVTPPPAAQSL
jgi:O-antigen/teichoic acid export membrane protein